jgi:hypothetical protein
MFVREASDQQPLPIPPGEPRVPHGGRPKVKGHLEPSVSLAPGKRARPNGTAAPAMRSGPTRGLVHRPS